MNYYELELEIQLPSPKHPAGVAAAEIPQWAESVCLYQTLCAADIAQATDVAHESYRLFCEHYDLTEPAIVRVEFRLLPPETAAYYERIQPDKTAGVAEHEETVFLRSAPGKTGQGCAMFLLIVGTAGFFFSTLMRSHTYGDLLLNLLVGLFVAMIALGVSINWRTKRKPARIGESVWRIEQCGIPPQHNN